jgi:hypothetical protein
MTVKSIVNLGVVLHWDSLLFFEGKNTGRTEGEGVLNDTVLERFLILFFILIRAF